ncbi:MAG: ParB/RepB/Spo0J family partition protein [Spirochaetota bacterium]
MICPDSRVALISINKIETHNDYFKISKPLQQELVRSVVQSGVIEPVLLLNQNERYVPVYGHNRIAAAQEAGIKEISARVINEITLDDFLQIVRVKLYHNLLGTLGKIKCLYLLYEHFNADKKLIIDIARELSLPISLTNLKNVQVIINLPLVIKNYIDSRAIAPKFVMPFLRLSESSIDMLKKIITACQMRVNYFNNIVVMIEDISRTGKEKILNDNLELLLMKDNVTDEDVYKCIYAIRYPEYTGYMNRVENIKNKLNAVGIKVEIPAYLEGDSINVIVEVRKNKPLHPLLEKDSNISGLIKSIIELL